MKQHEADYYESLEDNKVMCGLCPHMCKIADKRTGTCGARMNRQGRLYSEIYGMVTALAMDPIEKKPLYHFHPGKQILSIGTKGCNLRCPYCQNWHISQDMKAHAEWYSPGEIVRAALESDSVGIAYTYSEPVIWAEYVRDTAILAREKGLKNVMVTNGFVNEKPLDDLLNCVDAMNIDLKCFREDTFRKIHRGILSSVLSTIKKVYSRGCHLELTTLIVTGLNDSMDELSDIAGFISSIDPGIPWHISRYYPNYKYNEPATDIDFIMKVFEMASEKLDFVYCGNIPAGVRGNDTVCPDCGSIAVKRLGYAVRIENMDKGRCASCGRELNIRVD